MTSQINHNIDIFEADSTDKLSARLLKDDTNILLKPITKFCNLSISHGIFPNACKVKLKSNFKKSTKIGLSNYRPIALLLLISKIIDVVHDETNESLAENKILYN